MRIKSLFLVIFTLLSLAASAQVGGIKGRVVSRTDRSPLQGVVIKTQPATSTAITNKDGEFIIDGVDDQRYMVELSSVGYEVLTIATEVVSTTKDLYTLVLTPEIESSMLDEISFVEFDTESSTDGMASPNLSASKDLFGSIASYKFSEMRFATRGYDSQYSDVYLNGVRMNDALTGYSPWSLWSGLNDVVRNQETTAGLTSLNEYGVGGLAGSTNILSRASQLRQGWSTSLVSSNSMYPFRAMATYSSGWLDSGWAYAFSLSTRQGNSYIDGVYYNTFGYYGAVEKKINDKQTVSFFILGAPTERGVAQATTQEVYDLVGSNYYNPNWGYQDGEVRNTRVKEYHEPIAMLNYDLKIDDRSELNVAASLRFGQNGYSSLTWFAGNDPRPDYYRNLPSYYSCPNPAQLAEDWANNTNNITHMDFDGMYQVNYNGLQDDTYGDGHRANYMIEERHTDQLDANISARYSHIFENNAVLNAGLTARRNRTEYYTTVKDLMGGDYWVDVDKFAERDFGNDALAYQNNLDYYEEHGHAEAVTEGDKYSYDYYGHVIDTRLWASYNFAFSGAPALDASLTAEGGYSSMWREGLWRKGLFPTSSYGDSDKLNYLVYSAKAHLGYRFNRMFTAEANVAYMNDAPSFQSAFVSPRTRNDITEGIDTEKTFAVDATFTGRIGDAKFSLGGYYTTIKDQTDVISFYSDLQSSFDNFAISGIDKRYMGLEAALSIPIVAGISINGAASLGDYIYDSNPYFVEIADNSAEPLTEGTVNWDGFFVESTPQTALNLGLSYRSPNYLFAAVDLNYYDRLYLSMNPLFRTDNVLTSSMSAEEVAAMRAEEKMDAAYTLNASIGKSWYINRVYSLGFSLEVKNILDNQNIRTGGYEQMRVSESSDSNSYSRFDSKYFYMLGRTYYLNVYLRF